MKVALFETMPPMLKLVEERLDGDFILPEVSPHKTRISSLGNHNLDYIILMAVA